MKEMADCVPEGFPVKLDKPDVAVVLQTFQKSAGISIIKDGNYHKFQQYFICNMDE